MSEYFIITSTGSRGPFSAVVIQQGVAEGKIPPNAHLKDARTDATVRAGDVRADGLAAPTPAEPDLADSGQQAPVSPYPPQTAYPQQQYTPQQYAPQQPAHGGNYARGPYPGQQQAYPQQPYPQYQYPSSQYPPAQYPGTQPQYGANPYGQAPAYGLQYQPGMYPQARPQSGLAIAALVLSLATFVVCVPTWIGGIICGVMALKECAPNGPKDGRGMAQAGLWIGIGIGVLYTLGGMLWFAAIASGA